MGRVSKLAHDGAGGEMTLGVGNVIDRRMDGEESLGRALAFEALHFALSPADWKMRILRPVALSHPSRLMLLAQLEVMRGGTVRPQPIGHDTLRMDARILQQLAHKSQRSPLVSALLHQHVENLAFIVNSAPEIQMFPANANHHLVQMPARRWFRPCAPKPFRDANAKLERPAAHRLVTDVDAALGKQILDIPEAHREAEIEPNCMGNHARWKAVPGVRDWLHRNRATPPSFLRRDPKCPPTVNLTIP